MREFKLAIQCDNDAFADGNEVAEIVRILREVAERLEAGDNGVISGMHRNVHDTNGNPVGTFVLRERP